MNKAVYNKEAPTKNLITTISGLVTLLISGLVLFGILTDVQGADLTQYVTAIITAVAGIISIFKAEDSKASTLPKGGKKFSVLLMFLALPLCMSAQDTGFKGKISGFWRPMTVNDIYVQQGTKTPNTAFKIRPTATLVATMYKPQFDEAGKFSGFGSDYLAATGMGVSYAHYIVVDNEPYSDYSFNALLLLPTMEGNNLAVAGTVTALKFINAGVGYYLDQGAFKNNIFFLTGVALTF